MSGKPRKTTSAHTIAGSLLAAGLLAIGLTPAQADHPETIQLFNGKNLEGWTFDLRDPKAKMEDVWHAENGILVCRGRPVGYLRTQKQYSNYRLELEWRWPAGTKGGNSGVLIHAGKPRTLGIWPKSLEVQLGKGDAGDFWVIGTTIHVKDQKRRQKGRRHLNLTDGSEKPVGQWNKMVIEAKGDQVRVWVNGDFVNECTDSSVTRGAICLQSEGAPIHFRNIKLTPLGPDES